MNCLTLEFTVSNQPKEVTVTGSVRVDLLGGTIDLNPGGPKGPGPGNFLLSLLFGLGVIISLGKLTKTHRLIFPSRF